MKHHVPLFFKMQPSPLEAAALWREQSSSPKRIFDNYKKRDARRTETQFHTTQTFKPNMNVQIDPVVEGRPSLTVQLHEGMTVGELKKMIHSETGVPPKHQRLSVRDSKTLLQPETARVIESFHLQEGSRLDLAYQLKGGCGFSCHLGCGRCNIM
eukprot:GILJ01020936.1.p1 GENE.GILJ01020936.1~~GILJ01020936.1.p1  ORF type:complete len:155 (-),score=9.14 GILJ01020936.1:122-586(-)